MSNAQKFKPLSRPLAQLKPEYGVVVVGSGYGAAVAASRLARAGQSVCVLERGREILPGSYPNTAAAAQAEMQVDTRHGPIGSPHGLFNLHLNPDMLALVGCGLGGTSLINANVALEMDPRQFEHPRWPEVFRRNPGELATFTERAMQMLDAQPYPESFPALNKLEALQASAKAMRAPFSRPPIAVNFKDQVNPFGVAQARCTLCGDCTSGCNDGAKNTTLMNYLPDAHNHGAEIYTRVRVSHVERDGDGWRVHFAASANASAEDSDQVADESKPAPTSVRARVVVLGAGSLGSTEILLRSRERGLPLSDQLGRHFSGNGDVLAFGYNNHWPVVAAEDPEHPPVWKNINAIGRGDRSLAPAQLPGPCITGVIDMRNNADVRKGVVIEEGVIPGAIAAMIPAAGFMADAIFGNFLQYGPQKAASRLREAQAEGEAIMNTPEKMPDMAYAGATARSQVYLAMSVDDAGGSLRLEGDRLRIDWPGAGRAEGIARDNRLLQQANEAIEGHFIPSPLWTQAQGHKLITVHPLGGCGMGDDAASGVVNHKCQVFAATSGDAVHAGLYVCDGAVLPGAAGVNPLLTISALAERACALLAHDYGWHVDYTLAARRAVAVPATQPAATAATSAAPDQEAALDPAHAGALAEIRTSLLERVQEFGQTVVDELCHLIERILAALKAGLIAVATALLRALVEKFPKLLSPSFQFTEHMRGFVSAPPLASAGISRDRISTDMERATAWGRAEGRQMEFTLTIRAESLHQLVNEEKHEAGISGTVTCTYLSPQPMRVVRGTFSLLPVDKHHVETWRMTYDLTLEREGDNTHSAVSGPIHFHGEKHLHQHGDSSWWDDLTTLFVSIHEGVDTTGTMLAQGTLRLDLEDLMWQAKSARLDCAPGVFSTLVNSFADVRKAIELLYLGRFAGFFGTAVFEAYGGVLAGMKNFPAGRRPPAPRRALKAPAPAVHGIALPDGFAIRLTRYEGGSRGPVILAPGFSVRASSFAIATVDENFVEYLTARDYDVWLLDYRASPDSGSPIKAYTIDDIARIDWPAAVGYVLEETRADDLQVIAHCVGSMTLLMALLNGMPGVRSVISSALTLHPVTNWLGYLKVDLDVVRLMKQVTELGDGFNIVPGESAFEHTVDFLAWNVPMPAGEECKNPVCRRIFALFGPSYAHAQLDHATHDAMQEMFGRIAIAPFEQLARIVRKQKVVDCEGDDVYATQANAFRLKLPICFVTGSLNQIFDPETVGITCSWLTEQNGAGYYDQQIFEGYAHMDLYIGRNAARDIYPELFACLERWNPVRRTQPGGSS